MSSQATVSLIKRKKKHKSYNKPPTGSGFPNKWSMNGTANAESQSDSAAAVTGGPSEKKAAAAAVTGAKMSNKSKGRLPAPPQPPRPIAPFNTVPLNLTANAMTPATEAATGGSHVHDDDCGDDAALAASVTREIREKRHRKKTGKAMSSKAKAAPGAAAPSGNVHKHMHVEMTKDGEVCNCAECKAERVSGAPHDNKCDVCTSGGGSGGSTGAPHNSASLSEPMTVKTNPSEYLNMRTGGGSSNKAKSSSHNSTGCSHQGCPHHAPLRLS